MFVVSCAGSADDAWSAEPARAVLDCPKTATVGQLIVLDAGKSQGAGFAWTILPPTHQPNFLVIDGGRRAVLSSPAAGNVTIVLAVAAGDQVQQVVKNIEITGGVDPPTPPVDPLQGLAKLVRDWAKESVPGEHRAVTKAFASTFREVATACEKGAYATIDEAMLVTRERNQKILGEHAAGWTAWREKLTAELKAQYTSQKLKTPADLGKAYLEIVQGLEALAW